MDHFELPGRVPGENLSLGTDSGSEHMAFRMT